MTDCLKAQAFDAITTLVDDALETLTGESGRCSRDHTKDPETFAAGEVFAVVISGPNEPVDPEEYPAFITAAGTVVLRYGTSAADGAGSQTEIDNAEAAVWNALFFDNLTVDSRTIAIRPDGGSARDYGAKDALSTIPFRVTFPAQ